MLALLLAVSAQPDPEAFWPTTEVSVAGNQDPAVVSAVCRACEDVFFLPDPAHDSQAQMIDCRRNSSEPCDVNATMQRCFLEVDRTCADCKSLEHGCQWRLGLTSSDANLLSSHYSFCKGHTATSGAEMSHVAWRRVIAWKVANCVDGPPLGVETPGILGNRPWHQVELDRRNWWYPYTQRAEYERQQERRREREAQEQYEASRANS